MDLSYGEIIKSVCSALSSIAAVGKLPADDMGEFEKSLLSCYGVAVSINQLHTNKVKFMFVTQDDIMLNIVVDVTQVCREYIGNMFNDLRNKIAEYRHNPPPRIIV